MTFFAQNLVFLSTQKLLIMKDSIIIISPNRAFFLNKDIMQIADKKNYTNLLRLSIVLQHYYCNRYHTELSSGVVQINAIYSITHVHIHLYNYV